jgi:hypothetical protein
MKLRVIDGSLIRRRGGAVALVLLIAALLVPAAAMAGSVFDDVPDSNVHAANIAYLKQTGITVGCDKEGKNFCPNDPVTRAQMATFMRRLSGREPGTAPSVYAADSDLVSGFHADELIRVGYGQDDSLSLAGTNGAAVAATITAPLDGFLVISASSEFTGGADDTANCQIEVDGAMIGASRRSVAIDIPTVAAADCASDVVVEVGPGEHSIEYVFLNMAGSSVVDEAAVTAIFVPFNAVGVAPSGKGS